MCKASFNVCLLLNIFLLFSFYAQAQLSETTITCTRAYANPVPPNTRCNARGSLASPNVLRDFIAGPGVPGPRESCSDACFELGIQCNSYAFYTDGSNRCRLFRTTLSDQGFRTSPATPNVVFYGKACRVETCKSSVKTTLTTNTATQAYDDEYFPINLPFPVTFSHQTTRLLYMDVNGILSWEPPVAGASYSNTELPHFNGTGVDYLPPTSIVPFWNDNHVLKDSNTTSCNRNQDLSYTISGVNPSRIVKFNWRVSYLAPSGTGFVDVDVTLSENSPNKATIKFNEISADKGDTGTVGFQSQQANNYVQISYNSASISPGDTYVFDPLMNSFTQIT